MQLTLCRTAFLILCSLILVACSDDEPSTQQSEIVSTKSAPPSATRKHDFAQVSRGGKIFQANCAECHGKSAEGAANWRQINAQGKYPAPPLNGTGHAWHHPYKMLGHVIKNGSPGGQGDMPAWKEKLNDQQIMDVMEWFISKWPDQAYDAWYRMNQKAS
ncbi:MAG: cytochrome c [Gammaproteobacteria bacterium]|nr:cytochrome c [Gammaproteobacteria bacterium]